MRFLYLLGIPVFKKIHTAYGNDALRLVKKNKFSVQVDGRDTLQMNCISRYLMYNNSLNKLLYFIKEKEQKKTQTDSNANL